MQPLYTYIYLYFILLQNVNNPHLSFHLAINYFRLCNRLSRHCSRGGSQGDKGEESCDLMDQIREGTPCIRDSVEDATLNLKLCRAAVLQVNIPDVCEVPIFETEAVWFCE